MSARAEQDRFVSRPHRLVSLSGYLLIAVVLLRRLNDLGSIYTPAFALALLGIFTALYASEPRLARRIKGYAPFYFAFQLIIAQVLGLFQSYQDTWALLYVLLGLQVGLRFRRTEAVACWSILVLSTFVTLSIEFGLLSGSGRALAYIVIGVLLTTYDIQYAWHEDALAESGMLLAELRQAHHELADYAARAERLAALQEHDRMVQELYDSVGQRVFAIQLAAEATRLVLQKEPRRAAEQIDELQLQTQAALGQMRQLISQWRPD